MQELKYIALFIFLGSLLLSVAGCNDPTTGTGTGGDAKTNPSAWEIANPIAALPASPLGINSQLSDLHHPPTPTSVRLGRWLFHDKRLSVDNTVSCASCHQSGSGLSNNSALSRGVRGHLGTRKAPPVFNLAFVPRSFFFWDGRADSLETQAEGPILNAVEMGMNENDLLAKLQAIPSYPAYFNQAFGTSSITLPLITQAISDYERTRLSGNSPFDRWQHGTNAALSATAQRGFAVFGQVGCNHCHNGELFTDWEFHNTGVGYNSATQTHSDVGRFGVSANAADKGSFKTPTLREVASRAPYMHDGSIATLRNVVLFYNQGGNDNPNLDSSMRPLGLSANDINALVAFLQSLSGTGFADNGPSAFPQ